MIKVANKDYPNTLPVLTSLRFWAAYAGVTFHYTNIALDSIDKELFKSLPVISKLYLGVDFFFILSGFILTHVYLKKIVNGNFSYYDFYLKRIGRIYPVFFFAFLLTIFELNFFHWIGFTTKPEQVNLVNFTMYLLCIHAWAEFQIPHFNPPSWSISAEWFAYILFPFLIAAIIKIRLRYVILFVSILFIFLWWFALQYLGSPLTRLDFDYGSLRILPEFLFGICLYLLGQRYSLSFYNIKWFALLVVVMFVPLFFLMPDYITLIILGLIILTGAEQGRQNYEWAASKKDALYLGEISYSVYLLHIPLLEIALSIATGAKFSGTTSLALFFICFALVVPLSMLSYKYIEHPCRSFVTEKLLKKYHENRKNMKDKR